MKKVKSVEMNSAGKIMSLNWIFNNLNKKIYIQNAKITRFDEDNS
jgi:hypothetical protein